MHGHWPNCLQIVVDCDNVIHQTTGRKNRNSQHFAVASRRRCEKTSIGIGRRRCKKQSNTKPDSSTIYDLNALGLARFITLLTKATDKQRYQPAVTLVALRNRFVELKQRVM
jgi:hypothetical protein